MGTGTSTGMLNLLLQLPWGLLTWWYMHMAPALLCHAMSRHAVPRSRALSLSALQSCRRL